MFERREGKSSLWLKFVKNISSFECNNAKLASENRISFSLMPKSKKLTHFWKVQQTLIHPIIAIGSQIEGISHFTMKLYRSMPGLYVERFDVNKVLLVSQPFNLIAL